MGNLMLLIVFSCGFCVLFVVPQRSGIDWECGNIPFMRLLFNRMLYLDGSPYIHC